MFRTAYVRGIQLGLIQGGRASFADGGDAIKVADWIAERVDFDPLKPVPAEVTHKIAGHLIEASQILAKQPGFKAASFGKVSSWDEVHKLAGDNATNLMETALAKTAEGSTIEGADKGNDEAQAPAGETKMDVKQRPEGYATDSRGKTDVDTKPGAVGKEEEQPNKPAESPSKDNSVQEQSRTASLADIMKKIAEGSTILGADKGNKEMSSAEAKMDAAQRPEGYAVLPSQGALGELMNHMKGPAIIGRETAQPNKPAESPGGSNSLTQTSAKAAAEDPYIALFKKTASEVVQYIPSCGEEEKIAHVRACMGLNLQEKARYLTGLQKDASDKTAAAPAEVPPGSRTDRYMKHSPEASHSRPGAYDGRSGNQAKSAEDGGLPAFMSKKDDDKDEKKDDGEKKDLPPWLKSKDDGDKKDDDKEKEAAMRDHLRRIEDAIRAGR